jgi:holo-[acyl-carrier protein] synthase
VAVIGIGVDVVDVARFTRAVARTPRLLDRLLTGAEQSVGRPERLAARFAAKEAMAKALGAPAGLSWHDAEVVSDGGRPRFALRGTVAAAAAHLGVTAWHLSLSHDGGIAAAFVVLEGTVLEGPLLDETQASARRD